MALLYRISLVSLVVLVLILAVFPIQTSDIFMYLAIAREYFRQGSIPMTDPFLFVVKDYPWQVLHEWGGYFVFYLVYLLGSWNALIFFKSFLVLLSFILPWVILPRYRSPLYLVLGMIAAFAASCRFIERTSLFTDLFVTITLAIILREKEKPGRLKFFLPLLFLLWVNRHPGFPIGLALCAFFLFTQIKNYKTKHFQHFALILLVSTGLCFINPDGVKGFIFPFKFWSTDGMGLTISKYILEWFPLYNPYYLQERETWIFAALLIFIAVLLIKARHKKPVFETLSFFLLSFLAITAVRNVNTACFAFCALGAHLGRKLNLWNLEKKDTSKEKNIAIPIMFVSLAFCWGSIITISASGYRTSAGMRYLGLGIDPRFYPVESLKYIDEHLPQEAHVFNTYDLGCYLAWKWEGKRKVFFHGFFQDGQVFLNEYARFILQPDAFEALVNKHQIQAFLLTKIATVTPLIEATLKAHPTEWKLAFADQATVVYTKVSSD